VEKNWGPKTGEMIPAMAEIKFDAGGESGDGDEFEPILPTSSWPAL